MKLAERLDKALAMIVEAGAMADVRNYGKLARSLGFYDPPDGRTLDDLALTRFPTVVGRTRYPVPKHVRAADIDDYPLVDTWTSEEVANALWPIIKREAKRYSSGGWNRTKGAYDDDAFEENVQNARLGILNAIESEKDRGDQYLPWIKVAIRNYTGKGSGISGATDAASGFLGKMGKMSTPEQVNELIDTIPVQDRETDRPSKVKDGNRYGEHSPMLFRIATQLKQLFMAAMDPAADKAEAREAINSFKGQIEDERAELKGHGRILGPLTGMKDTISVSHSEGEGARFLVRLKKANSEAEVGAILTPKGVSKEVKEVSDLYRAAMKSGDETAIANARVKLDEKLSDIGGRDVFRAKHKREGVTTKGAQSGDDVENERMKGKSDKYVQDTRNKEIVKQILEAGISGIDVGGGKTVKLETMEYRFLIRVFGIDDYPLRKTTKDPEFDNELFKKQFEALKATIGNVRDDNAVEAAVYSKDEKRFFQEETARAIAMASGGTGQMNDDGTEFDGDIDYNAHQEAIEQTDEILSMFKYIPIYVSDTTTARTVAVRLAYSAWVRRGCPQMWPPSIGAELAPDRDRTFASKQIAKIFGSIKKMPVGRDELTGKEKIDYDKNKAAGWVYSRYRDAMMGLDPQSKMGLIVGALRGKLNLNPEDYDEPMEREAAKKEDIEVARSAFGKLYSLSAQMLAEAISESLDDYDRGLIVRARTMIKGYVDLLKAI